MNGFEKFYRDKYELEMIERVTLSITNGLMAGGRTCPRDELILDQVTKTVKLIKDLQKELIDGNKKPVPGQISGTSEGTN